jgi:hypothetical protein
MRATLPARKYPEPAARQFLIETALEAAAAQTGIRLSWGHRWHSSTSTYQRTGTFRLALNDDGLRTPRGRYRVKNGEKLLPLYSRTCWHGGFHVNAVCWHGHRDLFRALFAILPDLKVKTMMATYTGATFEDKFKDTYYINRGSRANPAEYGSLCICSEGGPQ